MSLSGDAFDALRVALELPEQLAVSSLRSEPHGALVQIDADESNKAGHILLRGRKLRVRGRKQLHALKEVTPSFRPPHGFTLVEVIVVMGILSTLLAILLPAIQQVRESSRRLTCATRIVQVGLAFHRHHEAVRAFPAGWRDSPDGSEGKAGLAWGFAILPFIEQEALWGAMKQDALVYAEENDSVRRTRVPAYRCPSDVGQAQFDVQRPRGTGDVTSCSRSNYTMTYPAAGLERNRALPKESRLFPPLTLKDITDGASHTILVGETATTKTDHRTWCEVWGVYVLPADAPESLGGLTGPHCEPFVAGRMMPSDGNWDTSPPFGHRDFDGFSSHHRHGVAFVFADAHVRFLPGHVSTEIKIALESVADGDIARID
jgi:prepilin-type N-terminal cleavage/methylation domain-containing protein